MDDQPSNCDPRSASVSCETVTEGPDKQEGKIKYEPVRATRPAGGMQPISSEMQTGSLQAEPTTVPAPDRASERRMRREMTKNKQPSSERLEGLTSGLPSAYNSPIAWKKNVERKNPSRRPNYFVSVPITNTQISSAAVEIQEAVLRQEPRLAEAMIPAPSLHVTLLVTHLANQEQIDMAAAALAQLKPSLAELLGGRDLVLSFSGVGQFRKEVVFMDLEAGLQRDTLKRLAELLRRRFEGQGLLRGDDRGFEPHLTVMKLSRAPRLRSQGFSSFDPALYSRYSDTRFGEQTVERLDLCSMLKKKQEDGYYHTESSLRIGGRCCSAPGEAELLRVSKRLVLQQYKQETLKNGGGPLSSYIITEEGIENPHPLVSMKVALPAHTEVHPPSRFGHQLDDNRLSCHSLLNREQTTCNERVEPFGQAVNFCGPKRAVPELAPRELLLQPALPVLGAWGGRNTTAGAAQPPDK